jgi:hypothetical protein
MQVTPVQAPEATYASPCLERPDVGDTLRCASIVGLRSGFGGLRSALARELVQEILLPSGIAYEVRAEAR